MPPESVPVGSADRHNEVIGRPVPRPAGGAIVVGIVGGGAFCTYAIERLAAEAMAAPPVQGMDVHIFNRTSRFGAGMAQDWDQPATSFMNRVASQIALAADESNAGAGNLLPSSLRPTFLEWLSQRLEEDGDSKFDLGPVDMPARQIHGEALRGAFERYAEILRGIGGVSVYLHIDEVYDVRPAGGDRLEVRGHRTEPIEVDTLLLVTGHPDNQPAKGSQSEAFAQFAARTPQARFIDQLYPLHCQLTEKAVPAGSSLGLLGMGLAAIDAILHLTEGRGGSFEPVEPGRLRYRRSGLEPAVIVPTAPSGLFPGTRPVNMKALDPTGRAHSELEHKPLFLTSEAVEQLRRAVGVEPPSGPVRISQLDFQRHIFPLLVLELAYVYYQSAAGGCGAPFEQAGRPRWTAFLAQGINGSPPSTDDLLEPLHEVAARQALRRFCWRSLFEPVPFDQAADPERWRRSLLAHLRADVASAERGNLADPVKSACDGVWRDLRSVFSQIADFGGLTAASQRQFMSVHWRHYCRMSNGAGIEAMQKILALCEEGIVDISIGPDPRVGTDVAAAGFRITGGLTGAERRVAVLAHARVHDFDAQTDRNPIYRNLLARGLVRLWRNPGTGGAGDFLPGSLDVTREFQAVRADGSVESRISILGAPVEGTAFFQLAAARPQSNNPILNACGRWAGRVMEMAAAKHLAAGVRRDLSATSHA